MANVIIHAQHRDILDELLTSARVSSVAGATKTGPFKEQREAYVFAASIGFALNVPTRLDQMPQTHRDSTQIRDSVFIGAPGAKELSTAVALILEPDNDELIKALTSQLEQITEDRLGERFAMLDRFAHAGFCWLETRRRDESSVRDLILTAIDVIECERSDSIAIENVQDPLLDMLGMKL